MRRFSEAHGAGEGSITKQLEKWNRLKSWKRDDGSLARRNLSKALNLKRMTLDLISKDTRL